MSQSGRSSGGASGGAGRRSGSDGPGGGGGGGEMDALLLGRTRELSTSGSGLSASTWRNWQGAGLSLIVISALCGMIVGTILLLAPPNGLGSLGRQANGRLTLEDLNSELAEPIVANGSWVSGSSFAYLSPEGALEVVEAPSGNKTRLLESVFIHRFGVRSWSLARDLRHLLMQIWDGRHYIYDLHEESLNDLHENHRTMQWADWGPVPTQLAFVRDHDLYYCSSVGAEAVRLTFTGTRKRRHARLSPFYAERVIGEASGGQPSARGLWWAPDGRRLAYVTMDETAVKEMVILRYTSSYPTEHRVPFPKLGETLPNVTLWVQLLEPSNPWRPPVEALPPEELRKDRSFYLTSVSWLNETHLAVSWSSSLLKLAFISLYDVTLANHRISSVTLVRQATDPSCPFLGSLTAGSPSGNFLFYLSPSGALCRQVAALALKSTENISYVLTKGEFQVERILGHNVQKRTLYLQVRPEKRRWEQKLLSLQYAGPAPHTVITSCLLCGSQQEVNCPVPEAEFSPSGSEHFVLTCRGRSFCPTVTLWASWEPRFLQDLDTSQGALKEALDQKARPRTLYIPLSLSRGPAEIPILLPPQSSTLARIIRFPLLIIFMSRNEWARQPPVDWPAYLSVNKHYACVLMDSSDAQEIPILLRELRIPGIELGPRLGVWARGSAAFYALKHVLQAKVYSGHPSFLTGHQERGLECLVALAPITDWRRADAVEARRYLTGVHKPELLEVRNMSSTQPTSQQIMIVHGTADEEVPVEHSLLLVLRLVQQAWLHRLLLYPDEGRDLPLPHLYAATEAFLHRCLRPTEIPHPGQTPPPKMVGKA